jgi:BMFP domain-containing protein YqiC
MQSQNRLFDDFVKMMNGAAGTFAGMTREAQESARERMREWVGGMDFVSRDEFEAVKAMAATAREEVEAMRNRLAALEAATGKGAASTVGTGSRQSGPTTEVETPEE